MPFPSPGEIPDPGVELRSPALQADSLWSGPAGNHIYMYIYIYITINSKGFFAELLAYEFVLCLLAF